MMPTPHFRVACLTVMAATCLNMAARADDIRIGPHWYRQISVQEIADGQIIYVNAAGTELTADLLNVGAVVIDAYPPLASVQLAIEEGNDQEAYELLNRLQIKHRPRWHGDWVTYLKMSVAARLGDAPAATAALAELARRKADSFFFDDPPVGVFARAQTDAVRRAQLQLDSMRHRATGAVIRALEAMQAAAAERLGAGDVQPPVAPAEVVEPSGPGPTVMLPRALDGNDPITRLLRRGELESALAQAEGQLNTTTKLLARRLYQRGVARLALADRSGDLGLYKSAALDFMRIVVYRPRSNGYVGPALMEAGYAHRRIGREDLAQRLFARARLYIDETDEPELAGRLEQLRSRP